MDNYKIENVSQTEKALIANANDILARYMNMEYNECAIKAELFVAHYATWLLSSNNIQNLKVLSMFDKLNLLNKSQPKEIVMELRAVWERGKFYKENNNLQCRLSAAKHSMYVTNFCMMHVLKKYGIQDYVEYLRNEIDNDLAHPQSSFEDLKEEQDTMLHNFYKNAMRAEKYFYQKDFYINMTCSRMAVEAFVNFMLKDKDTTSTRNKFGMGLSEKILKLKTDKTTDKASIDDTLLAVHRGNNNVHSSVSGYYFSARHNVDLLISCKNKLLAELQKV